jgi:biopolymer transport protein TolR
MARRAIPDSAIITKVNVTPIIDVALVLVIILLVTAPLLSVADLPVDLPQAHTREAEDQRNISITVSADGQLALDTERITADGLRARLAQRLAEPGNRDVLVVLRADSGLTYGQVRQLLSQARAAGARRLAVATRQRIEPNR